jgi:large subunit ribosomal protein L25
LDVFDLKATKRDKTGKGQARELRRHGLIPAVLYGPKMEAMALSVSVKDLQGVYKESGSEHMVLNLIIDNGGTQKKTAMIKELQTAPATSNYLHVDFYEIALDQAIVVNVPVEVVGTSKGVERGGYLQVVRHSLEVSCLPTDVPTSIPIDISGLDIGDSVHVEDITVGEKVSLLYDTNFTVVTVVAPSVEEEVPEEEVLEEGEAEEVGEAEESQEAGESSES